MLCIANPHLQLLLLLVFFFLKELNGLLQLLTTIGESIPHRDRLRSLRQKPGGVSRESISNTGGVEDGGLNFISLLESCQLSLAGIVVTVSTPLDTAIRFSTGKIEMTLTNTSSQSWQWGALPRSAAHQLSLDGRVDIDINLALGYLQAVGPDVVDDLCELAYFRTRVSIRNTLQNLYSSNERQGGAGEGRMGVEKGVGGEDGVGGENGGGGEMGMAVDTFLISISSPHLYLQSSAVEQGQHLDLLTIS